MSQILSATAFISIAIGILSVLGFMLFEFAPNSGISVRLGILFGRSSLNLKELNRLSIFELEEFARIEKFIPNIRSVVVVSRRIDEPRQGLHDAVYDNFQQGARYSFFISNIGHTTEEIAHYKTWFRAIFDVAKDNAPSEGENAAIHAGGFDTVLSIKELPMDWSHVPYVFYTYEDESGEIVTLALKGTTPGVGISTRYLRVEPSEAKAILDLCGRASKDFDDEVSTADVVLEPDLPETNIVYIHGGGQEIRQAVG